MTRRTEEIIIKELSSVVRIAAFKATDAGSIPAAPVPH